MRRVSADGEDENTKARRTANRGLLYAVCGLIPAFLTVQEIVNMSHHHHHSLAVEWSQRGERAVGRGDYRDAIEDFATALKYRPDDGNIRIRLAEVLLAEGRNVTARGQLQDVLRDRPTDGHVNFMLARIAMDEGDTTAALEYYHAAVNGVWSSNTAVWRRQASRERDALIRRLRGSAP